LYILILRF